MLAQLLQQLKDANVTLQPYSKPQDLVELVKADLTSLVNTHFGKRSLQVEEWQQEQLAYANLCRGLLQSYVPFEPRSAALRQVGDFFNELK
jgi:predicted component of type VI protein secretion system